MPARPFSHVRSIPGAIGLISPSILSFVLPSPQSCLKANSLDISRVHSSVPFVTIQAVLQPLKEAHSSWTRWTIYLCHSSQSSSVFFRIGNLNIGDPVTRKANVRMIATTNADLERAVKERRFREDLFYRLNIIQIEIPPLRERPGRHPPRRPLVIILWPHPSSAFPRLH